LLTYHVLNYGDHVVRIVNFREWKKIATQDFVWDRAKRVAIFPNKDTFIKLNGDKKLFTMIIRMTNCSIKRENNSTKVEKCAA